jgi:hypothetical protein
VLAPTGAGRAFLRRLWPSFAHGNDTVDEEGAIEAVDRLSSLIDGSHLDISAPSEFAAYGVCYEMDGAYGAGNGEEFPQFYFSSFKRDVSDVQFATHSFLLVPVCN